MPAADPLPPEFPGRLDRIRANLRAGKPALRRIAALLADAFAGGGLVHVHANGHSCITVEESCVRMGALTGLHPMREADPTTFTDIGGVNLLAEYETTALTRRALTLASA